jgi:hypothetical protein
MDELDKLRDIWQQAPVETGKRKEDLARMLQGESISIVARLKRNVKFELIFTIITGLVLLYIGITTTSMKLMWVIYMLGVMYLVYLIYYIRKLRLLNRFSMSEGALKTNLQHLTETLSGYLTFYKISYIVLYPLFYLTMLWLSARETGTDIFLQAFNDTTFLVIFLVLTLLIMASAYAFTGWYLKKLYGNHLKKLQGILKELNESTTE